MKFNNTPPSPADILKYLPKGPFNKIGRDLVDLSRIKSPAITAEKVLDVLGIGMDFFGDYPPLDGPKKAAHQLKTMLLMIHNKRLAIFGEMAVGKTFIATRVIQYLRAKTTELDGKTVLFTVPNPTVMKSVADDMHKFLPELKICCMHKAHGWDGRLDNLSQYDIVIGHYQGLASPGQFAIAGDSLTGKTDAGGNVTVRKGNVIAIHDPRGTPLHWGDIDEGMPVIFTYADGTSQQLTISKSNWEANEARIKGIAPVFGMIVIDEVHNLNARNTLWKDVVKGLMSHAVRVYGMTGTPFKRDMMSAYYLFDLIVGREVFHSVYMFHHVFFTPLETAFARKWEFKKAYMPILLQIIRAYSIHWALDEVLDIPKFKMRADPYALSESTQRAYDGLITKTLRMYVGDDSGQETGKKGVAVKAAWMRLQGICSGMLNVDVEGTTHQVVFEDTRKIDMIINYIKAVPAGQKVVVFMTFVALGDMLKKRLEGIGVRAEILKGRLSAKEQTKRKYNFEHDPSCQVLLVNYKIGAAGLNLQFANHVVLADIADVNAVTQAQARIRRPGQTQEIFVYFPYAEGTVEETLIEYLQEGTAIRDQVMEVDQLSLIQEAIKRAKAQ
jgi:peroxiredoxin family protein/ABC-type dipeptide/oligopeptide/nickel transport system ATPase component